MSSKFLDKTGLDTLWAKIKSTFQTVGNLVKAWGSTPSDTKYPSEKLVKTSLDAKATDSAVLHKAGLETASGQKWFEGGFCVFNTSNVGYGHYTLPGADSGTKYNNWPEEYKDGAHFREWRLSFNTGINFWGKLRITIATSFSSFNASGSMQKTINCAFNTAAVFNNTGYYNDLGINSEKEFRISDLIWNNTTECWEIKIHSIKPASNNAVPVLLIEFWTYSTTNRDSALGIHWVSTTPDIVTDTTYYTKRTGNASTTPGTGGVQFNWEDMPVQQSPYGYEIFNRSHTIPIGNGGTGKTSVTAGNYLVGNGTSALTEKTPNVAANDLINALTTGESTPTDNDYYVAQYAGGGTTTKTFHRRPVKALWEYIKGKISSVLGLTATAYGGNAATATTAAGYTSGGAIDTALQGKATPADITSAIQALDVASQGGDGKYIKAISEADGKISATEETMDTAPTANSTKAVTSGGVKTALDDKVDKETGKGLSTNDFTDTYKSDVDSNTSARHTHSNKSVLDSISFADVNNWDGKQDALGISSSGDMTKYLNEKGEWAKPSGYPVKTAYSSPSAYGVKLATTTLSSANGITSYGTFYFQRLQIGQGIKTLSANANQPITGTVQIFHRREQNGTLTIRGRVTVLQSDFTGQIRLYYVQNGNNVDWYIATTDSYGYTSWAIQQLASFISGGCSFTATELSFITSLTGLTENDASYKTPLVAASSTGTGSPTKPVYVNGNGRLEPCTYGIAVGYSSANNTICFY